MHYDLSNVTPAPLSHLLWIQHPAPIYSSATIGELLLCASFTGSIVLRTCCGRADGNLDALPVTQKLPKQSPDENTDDDVAVEVHGEKHDEVGHREGRHMDDRPNELLKWRWPEGDELLRITWRVGGTAAVLWTRVGEPSCSLPVELLSHVHVVFLAETSEELESHYQEDDSDA